MHLFRRQSHESTLQSRSHSTWMQYLAASASHLKTVVKARSCKEPSGELGMPLFLETWRVASVKGREQQVSQSPPNRAMETKQGQSGGIKRRRGGKRSRVVAVVDLNHDTRLPHDCMHISLVSPRILSTFPTSTPENLTYLTARSAILKTRGTCPSRAHLSVKADV